MYSSRKTAMQRTTKPPLSLASVPIGSVPGTPDAASMSCIMSHDTIRFREPPINDENTARHRAGMFLW